MDGRRPITLANCEQTGHGREWSNCWVSLSTRQAGRAGAMRYQHLSRSTNHADVGSTFNGCRFSPGYIALYCGVEESALNVRGHTTYPLWDR
jgi:hypothetical protein